MVPFCNLLYAKRTKSTNLFISYSPTIKKGYKCIYFYEAMRQRKRIYWNGYDAIFQRMHMNKPSKIFVVQDFSITSSAAATLLFLPKQKGKPVLLLLSTTVIFNFFFFIPIPNYFHPKFNHKI